MKPSSNRPPLLLKAMALGRSRRLVRAGSALGLASVTLLSAGLVASANRPMTARILDFHGSGSNFWIRSSSGARADSVTRQAEIYDGGSLSVPDRNHWASFGFFGGDQRYRGLLVKTYDWGIYTFACRIQGHHIVGWSGSNGRPCSRGDHGIQIQRARADNSAGNPISRLLDFAKQASSISDLSIEPGEQLTLIRTQQSANNAAAVTVEVFQGSVDIEAPNLPQSGSVVAGQKYSSPSGTITPFNASAEANTCEMLRFLNPFYWSAENTPEEIRRPMADQLRQYREALGVSGQSPNLPGLEQGVVDEMNRARTNPALYAELLAERRQYFRGNRLELPGQVPLVTNEGSAAYDEAIAFLRATRTLPPLTASAGLSQAAQDLVAVQTREGGIGHGTGATDMSNRLARHGTVGCASGENVSYGSGNARDVVIQLIVDDGLPSRKHREIMFNPDFQVTGAACGSHPQWRSMCAITYANGYLEAGR
ncbi:CAP domain-containing protein [Nodosilinea sp. PGN35]|uniref:CAP domain-containing protein n=1 Tax=Nodosilinea sp. PGN35 TaxID=3020489 RepID=UPI0023B2EBDA|nr:CAP domain-containing protein [Nodosilinea sp. TSF1-S3]MDF0368823.1 CAP domain-containing protein [Nodosilinea sp. TSF1-S3]